MKIDDSALKAWQAALANSMKIDDSALKAWQAALANSMKIDDSVLKAWQAALANSMKIDDSVLKAWQAALANSMKIDDSVLKAAGGARQQHEVRAPQRSGESAGGRPRSAAATSGFGGFARRSSWGCNGKDADAVKGMGRPLCRTRQALR